MRISDWSSDVCSSDLVVFPKTAEEWAEPRWVDYACHADAPWLDDRLRQRIHDFVTVLRCRYPTVQDLRSPAWAKHGLRAMAGWRYQHGKYARPWGLELATRLVRLRMPPVSGLRPCTSTNPTTSRRRNGAQMPQYSTRGTRCGTTPGSPDCQLLTFRSATPPPGTSTLRPTAH